jgi:hypothetical protein
LVAKLVEPRLVAGLALMLGHWLKNRCRFLKTFFVHTTMSLIISESRLSVLMQRYWPVTYVAMVLSFLIFGAASVNLAQTFLLNIRLIQEHGLLVLMEGALNQLLELLLTAGFSVSFYLIFKTCESVLLQRILVSAQRD